MLGQNCPSASSLVHWARLNAPGSGTASPTASKSTSGVTVMHVAPTLLQVDPAGGAATVTIVGGSVGPSAPTTYATSPGFSATSSGWTEIVVLPSPASAVSVANLGSAWFPGFSRTSSPL